MDMVDLIVIIARNYKETIGIAPAKTKLLKLAKEWGQACNVAILSKYRSTDILNEDEGGQVLQ